MEKRNSSFGRPLFVDEETDKLIHPYNSLYKKKQEEWEAKGIYYRYGKWTNEEKEKLLENWNWYLEKYDSAFEDPLDLLDRRGRSDLIALMKDTQFFKVISRSLNRPTDACYYKLRRDVRTITLKNGKFLEEEMKQLKKLSRKHRKNFQYIADKMGRDRQSVQDKLRRHEKAVKSKNWTGEEEEELIEAIREVSGLQDLNEIKQLEIPWRSVAELVPTRHEEQCRAHFSTLKRWKLQNIDGNASHMPKWRRQHSYLLIDILSNGDYSIETDIDWNEINQSFVDVSPSATYIQKQFYKLKSGIPDFHRKSFSDLLEEIRHLHSSHKHIPN
ncbi:cyclin-D-binding Myb-like transcription factor 1 [Mytilus californianus]|uniref:cyclin-D-binding Myb-like transcription factor 1 n=1 Tax=Mytilus californianus TaxID=6549 RepID=UPI002245C425|nr:cyclin-D-binding Myb-like transcription factor 1 [Mytilus californianus]XP_052081348.1 cyclin-D-binding Myb-like transcription factor 1 [Mytilus californianus]